MSLNLAQTREIINSGPRPVANVANPTGEASVMSDLYRELKAAGWQSTGQLHPADRVSLLTLGSATIRRNRNVAPGAWIVEVAGGEFYTAASVSELTERVKALLAESVESAADPVSDDQIKPLTPAQDAAQSLTAELAAGLSAKDADAIAKRIAAGLELHTAAAVSQYNTEWDNAGALGNWRCDCPDATHRALTSKYGQLCKHTAAGMIAQRVAQAQAAVTQREVEKRQARAIARGDYASPSQYRPAADPLNTVGHSQNFRRAVNYGGSK